MHLTVILLYFLNSEYDDEEEEEEDEDDGFVTNPGGLNSNPHNAQSGMNSSSASSTASSLVSPIGYISRETTNHREHAEGKIS